MLSARPRCLRSRPNHSENGAYLPPNRVVPPAAGTTSSCNVTFIANGWTEAAFRLMLTRPFSATERPRSHSTIA